MAELTHGEGEGERRVLQSLALAVGLSSVVLAIEAVGAYFSHSLSVTVDAVHNVPDLFAFALSYWALSLTRKGATPEHTFGLHRTEVFAAVVNATLVLVTGAVFAYEAIRSLASGGATLGAVDPAWILAAAVPTLLLRSAAAVAVGRVPSRVRDLNLRSVLLHLASDVTITAALVVAGLVLWLRPSVAWADPAAALFVAGVLVVESLPLFRDSWAALTERVPSNLSVAAISREAAKVPGVEQLHDLHVWSVCSSLVCMTAHVSTDRRSVRDGMAVVAELRHRMADEFGIVHAVFEVESGSGPDPPTAGAPPVRQVPAA